MRHVALEGDDFDGFRAAARGLLAEGIAPGAVLFGSSRGTTGALAGFEYGASLESTAPGAAASAPRVPREFLDAARRVACHSDPERWSALYRVLWRLSRGEPELLRVAVDPDVRRLTLLERAVARDVHKMHAFVRFRRVEVAGEPLYVAWHRPDHRVLRLATPLFAERFNALRWWVLTPEASASWDGAAVHFGPGAGRDAAPAPDEFEALWTGYYASVFNPARVKVRAMKREMPLRHWSTLPEAALIADLVRGAPARAEAMAARQREVPSAESRVPRGASLSVLREAARACDACALCEPATQTVFGEGPADARLVLVGEQPGDEEDRAGRPFIGPAGRLLDGALGEAGVARESVYLTNAVKHFRHRVSGKRRIHETPRVPDVAACRPWLDAELSALRPAAVVCLGATAARALLGPSYRGGVDRGRWYERGAGPALMATYHPAAILRAPDERSRAEMHDALVDALRAAAARRG